VRNNYERNQVYYLLQFHHINFSILLNVWNHRIIVHYILVANLNLVLVDASKFDPLDLIIHHPHLLLMIFFCVFLNVDFLDLAFLVLTSCCNPELYFLVFFQLPNKQNRVYVYPHHCNHHRMVVLGVMQPLNSNVYHVFFVI